MTRTASDPALAAWLALVNDVGHPERAHDVCLPDVLVHAYPAGKGGRREVFQGTEAIVEWLRRAPPGRFRFVLLAEEPAPAHPELPPAERAVRARYRVENVIDEFTNEGDWLLHASGDRLVALHHAPEPLPVDCGMPALRPGVDLDEIVRESLKRHGPGHEHDHEQDER